MSLTNYRVGAAIAVSDMNRARDFYEGKLGFAAAGDDLDGGSVLLGVWERLVVADGSDYGGGGASG